MKNIVEYKGLANGSLVYICAMGFNWNASSVCKLREEYFVLTEYRLPEIEGVAKYLLVV